MARRLRNILIVCGFMVALVYLAAACWGRGGRGYFSPDTLDCRSQSEWLVPFTKIPVYRGPSSMDRYPAADWLIARGFWSKSDAPDPKWLPMYHWNMQWQDGESRFHRELGWRGQEWIQWSKDHPAMAKVLWPRVLAALRRPGITSTAEASDLLAAAQHARKVEEFEKMAKGRQDYLR